MAQEINLNVSPYFDDFDATKDFHKVLFKPGLPIQARELTTLQSILQNQIEQVGTHLFKEGSCVIPGQINYNNTLFTVEVETTFLGIDLTKYWGYLTNTIVRGSNSGVKAKIITTLQGASDRGYLTMIVTYLGQGLNDKEQFDEYGEVLFCEGQISIKYFDVCVASCALSFA